MTHWNWPQWVMLVWLIVEIVWAPAVIGTVRTKWSAMLSATVLAGWMVILWLGGFWS